MGSKLAPPRAVLKFDLHAVHRSTMQKMAHRRTILVDVRFLLEPARCLGSIVVSVIGTLAHQIDALE
jgi:hypothetical protein